MVGRSVPRLEKEPLPSSLKDNEVLIKMLCAPVNPADWNIIEGAYPIQPQLPAVGGIEGVGKVLAVGKNVHHIKVSDYVIPAKQNFGIAFTQSLNHSITQYTLTHSQSHIPILPLILIHSLNHFFTHTLMSCVCMCVCV
jgi:trans-2-enoyl-CoA reductase